MKGESVRANETRRISDDMQISLFSQSRLSGYENTSEHEQNLALIASLAHKIGIIELILRNKIDTIISQTNPNYLEKYIKEYVEEYIKKYKEKHSRPPTPKPNPSKDEFISSQNLGFWIEVVDHFKIHNQIFSIEFIDSIDFKSYFEKNKDTFKEGHNRLLRHHKVRAILGLVRLIRNRAFHFENLYKMNREGGKIKGPRLSEKIWSETSKQDKQYVIISIHPSKIIDFLNDILASFHKDLIYYAEKVAASAALKEPAL